MLIIRMFGVVISLSFFIFAAMSKERSGYLDFAKGILIFLVILGHCVQFVEYKCEPLFWSDHLFKFIYTFHMPLFVGISGYLSYTSIKRRNFYSFAKSRMLYLLVPMLFWCIIGFGIDVIINSKEIDLVQFIRMFTKSYWFIWAILLFSFVIAVFSFFKLDNIYILILSAILLTALPFKFCGYPLIKSMYPFFVLGYFLAQIDLSRLVLLLKRYQILLILFSVIFYFLWDKDVYPYITPSGFSHMKITLLRLVTSTTISIFVLLVLSYIYPKIQTWQVTSFIVNIGKETLGLYLMQGILFTTYASVFMDKDNCVYSQLACWGISIIYIVVFYYLIRITNRVPVLRTIVFGKK